MKVSFTQNLPEFNFTGVGHACLGSNDSETQHSAVGALGRLAIFGLVAQRQARTGGARQFFGCQGAWKMALSPRRATGTQRTSEILISGTGVPVRGGRVTKNKGNGRGKSPAKPEMLLKLELHSNPEALCLVRATVERAAEVLHFQDTETRAIVRSVDEALANVLRHAYGGRPGLPIEMSCSRLGPGSQKAATGGIEILLADKGTPVKPSTFKGRPLDEIRPGGLGLHFIRQSMDEVEFSRKKGKNLLRMVKYLSPTSQAAASEGDQKCR
ncbi:MAG TPA: ATP-binding protein [Candidatus Acidoferrum sp.]|nr:ATP-binding protein [Candidatus Acidoferrum sp.]